MYEPGWRINPRSRICEIFSGSYTIFISLDGNYLQTNLASEGDGEDIVSFAQVIIPGVVLVYRVLGSNGDTEVNS